MSKEKVLEILKIRGPVLPLEIGKATGLDSIMAGAYLSELVSNKRAKLSYLKIGGSPLYYVDGQEHKLQNFKDSLKGPEKKAFEILKEAKLLKDADLEPVIRVSFQNMKDFAKPIEITQNSHKELYWKWYLVRNDQLKEILSPAPKAELSPEAKEEPTKEPTKEEKPEPGRQGPAPETKEAKEAKEAKEEKEEKEAKEEEEKYGNGSNNQQSANSPEPSPRKEEPETRQEEPGKRKEEERSSSEQESEPELKREQRAEERSEPKTEIKEEPSAPSSDFEESVQDFFNENNIDIISKKVIRADSEIEYQLLIPSAIGKILYFAVARSKKRCSDADLSQLFVAASIAKLPGLFIHSGDLTKKAKEKLKTDFKIIMTYKI